MRNDIESEKLIRYAKHKMMNGSITAHPAEANGLYGTCVKLEKAGLLTSERFLDRESVVFRLLENDHDDTEKYKTNDNGDVFQVMKG